MAAGHGSFRSREGVHVAVGHRAIAMVLSLAAIALPACGPTTDSADAGQAAATAGRLVLAIDTADTAPDGRRCILGVTARNDTGHPARNVQAAWMARTDGFGSISDYQVLGDFTVDEVRLVQLGIFGPPCDAVREVTLSRAVCTVDAADGPPRSCAGLVMMLDNFRFATRR